jgi:hypothetical protein
MNTSRIQILRLLYCLIAISVGIAWQHAFGLLPPEKPVFWPRIKYDRVVGYQYANPWKLDGLIFEGGLLVDRLPHLKTLEKELSKEQAHQLLQFTFTRGNQAPSALCYIPHHVFIFYEGKKAVAAIDVCFMCDKIRCWPAEDIWKTTNFAELKRLCVDLGIGTDAPSNEAKIIEQYRKQFGDESIPK